MLRRYGSVNVPITSLGALIYGTVLLVAPASSFTSPAFAQGPFLFAAQRSWGVAFIAAAVLALTLRHVIAILPLLLAVTGWSVFLVLAAIAGEHVTPTAGISWAIITTQLLVSVSIRGTSPRPPRAPRGSHFKRTP